MLSLIVPVRNDVTLSRNCIQCALHSLSVLQVSAQVILIDDQSPPEEGIMDMFREMRERGKAMFDFTLVRTAKREHYTGVFSLGLTLAKREHAFFLSNDMLITPKIGRAHV